MERRKKWKGKMLIGAAVFLFFARGNVVAEEKEAPDFREMTVQEIVQDMGAGWNLGNTLDGHFDLTPGETAWQGKGRGKCKTGKKQQITTGCWPGNWNWCCFYGRSRND